MMRGNAEETNGTIKNQSPMVSIVCNTYNHEKYIRDALEGFIDQKTNYSYEILVYDDASKDKTVDIIREYEKKYPNLLSPIYQTTNQYSKGLKPIRQNISRAKGKYIAICEGDDYWIDPYKLEKQISYMEENPECTFCFTNAKVQYSDHEVERMIPSGKTPIYRKGQVKFNVGEIAVLGFIPTASFVFRNGLEWPSMPEDSFLGDKYIELSMTSYGYAFFINEPMVVYRRDVPNSMMSVWSKDKESYKKARIGFCKLYKGMNEYTCYRYDNYLGLMQVITEIGMYSRLEDIEKLKMISKSERIKYLRLGNVYTRVVYNVLCKYPKVTTLVKNISKYKPKC